MGDVFEITRWDAEAAQACPDERRLGLERFDIPASVLRPGQNALTVRNCGSEESVYRLYKVSFEPLV